jgi:hypothetical protein
VNSYAKTEHPKRTKNYGPLPSNLVFLYYPAFKGKGLTREFIVIHMDIDRLDHEKALERIGLNTLLAAICLAWGNHVSFRGKCALPHSPYMSRPDGDFRVLLKNPGSELPQVGSCDRRTHRSHLFSQPGVKAWNSSSAGKS